MDVTLTVTEVEGKDGFFGSSDDLFNAAAALEVDGVHLLGYGVHMDQAAAEALALADLKIEYRNAFPPVKTLVVKTLSVDPSEW